MPQALGQPVAGAAAARLRPGRAAHRQYQGFAAPKRAPGLHAEALAVVADAGYGRAADQTAPAIPTVADQGLNQALSRNGQK